MENTSLTRNILAGKIRPVISEVNHDILFHSLRQVDMNKSELIHALKESKGISQTESNRVVDRFFDAMTEALARGCRVELRGLWAFRVKKYKSYSGRKPKTGEQVTVKPKKLPFFKPGTDLKKRVDR